MKVIFILVIVYDCTVVRHTKQNKFEQLCTDRCCPAVDDGPNCGRDYFPSGHSITFLS